MSLSAASSSKISTKNFPQNILKQEHIQNALLSGDAGSFHSLLNQNIRDSLAMSLVESGKRKNLSLDAAKKFINASDFASLLGKTASFHPAIAAIGLLQFILEKTDPPGQKERAKSIVDKGILRKLTVKNTVAPQLSHQVLTTSGNSSDWNPKSLEKEKNLLENTVNNEYNSILKTLLSNL